MSRTLMSRPLLRILALAAGLTLAAGAAQAAPSTAPGGCGAPDSTLLAAIAPALDLTPAPAVSSPATAPQPIFAAMAYCEADCDHGPNVWCTGSTCSAQDDPWGYVTCDGVTTRCRRPDCTDEGALRWVDSGCCCQPGIPAKQRSVEQRCTDGRWVSTGRFGCAGGCAGSCLEP